tara:strand:- start:683 stop:1444 length:762 start_codon:yes stop_codon:yes gene_type:complete
MKDSPFYRKGPRSMTDRDIDRKIRKADRKLSKVNPDNSDRKNERKIRKANKALDQAASGMEVRKRPLKKSFGDNMFTSLVSGGALGVPKSPLNMLGVSRSQSELAELEKKRDSVNQRIPKSLGGLHPSKKMGGAYGTADDDMDFKSRTDEQIAVLKPKKKSPLNNYENPKREYFSNREDFANLFKTVGDATAGVIAKKTAKKAKGKLIDEYAAAKKNYNDDAYMLDPTKGYGNAAKSYDLTEEGIKYGERLKG